MKRKGPRPHAQTNPASRKRRIQGLPKWPPNSEQIKAISGFMLNLAVLVFAAFGAALWSTPVNVAALLLSGIGGALMVAVAILLLYDIDKEA